MTCCSGFALCAALVLSACRSAPTDSRESPVMQPDPVERMSLINELRREGVTDEAVLRALQDVPREEFVLAEDRPRAYSNRALPIHAGQTISQPLIVGLMTQLLLLHGDERVLEVGTGSGYQAAVLSRLAREVYSIELDPQLAAEASQRLADVGYANVRVRCGDGFFGWQEAAPFDAVIITAVAPRIPEHLIEQLKPEGVIVLPLEEYGSEVLIRAVKHSDGNLEIEHHGAVAFVPMRGAVRTPTLH